MKKAVWIAAGFFSVALVVIGIAGTFEDTTIQHQGSTGLKDLCRLIDANFDAVATATSADGNFQIASNLTVAGTSSLTGAVTVVGNESVGGWLKVTGATTGSAVVATGAITAGTGVSGVWGNFSGAVTAATGVASAAGVTAGTGVSGVWGNFSGAFTANTFTASGSYVTQQVQHSTVLVSATQLNYVTYGLIFRGNVYSGITGLTTNISTY